MSIRTAVIIINYKTPTLTINCLESLIAEINPAEDRVYVVDNFSNDDSVNIIAAYINTSNSASWIEFIALTQNIGFAKANNMIISKVEAAYYLLLNSDTVAKKNFLKLLTQEMEKDAGIGIISPRMESVAGETQVNARRFPNPIGEFISSSSLSIIARLLRKYEVIVPEPGQAVTADWVNFACALIRKEVIRDIGLLDDYFMYFEDADYCRMAWQKGWKVVYFPESRIIHLKGSSSKIHDLVKSGKRIPRYFYESRSRYFGKFYGISGLWVANILWALGKQISFVKEILRGRKGLISKYAWVDIWINSSNPLRKVSGSLK